jgi:hypothetical protein
MLLASGRAEMQVREHSLQSDTTDSNLNILKAVKLLSAHAVCCNNTQTQFTNTCMKKHHRINTLSLRSFILEPSVYSQRAI